MNNDLITLKETSEILKARGISIKPATLRVYIFRGKLPEAVKQGRDWYLPRSYALNKK